MTNINSEQRFLVINKELVNLVLSGNKKSEREFYNLAERLIWGALTKFSQLTHEDQEDLFQSVWLKLYADDKRRIKMWNEKSKFSTFLYSITTNSVLDYLRGKVPQNQNKFIHDNENSRETVLDSIIGETNPYDKELDPITLQYALNKLNSDEKEIITLHYFNGVKEREIADKLGKSINTISSKKSRALKKIRLILQD